MPQDEITSTFPPKMRVAIVTPSLASYRVPVFNRLQEIPGLELQLIFGDGMESARGWDLSLGDLQFNYTLLPTVALPLRTLRGDLTAFHWSPDLWNYLNRQKFDLVVSLGWTMPNTFLVRLNGKLHHRAVVLWDESIPHTPGRLKKFLLPLLKKYLGSFDGYLAASHGCIEYMVQMGAPRARVFLMPQLTDNAFYAAHAALYRVQRDALKREVGIQTRQVILYVGQLTPRKNVLQLLEAFREIARTRHDVSLLLVGEGTLQAELMARREEFGLQDRVCIEPFVAQAVLPQYYALADVFVLPSLYDTFGVVVAEAMACGLPIVTTDTVGAASSIVVDGVNGLVVEHGNRQALAQALEKILADDALRARMGAASERIIATWDVERMAQNFINLLALCLKGKQKIRAARRDAVHEA